MRESCLDCGRKHVAQAAVLMDEAVLGYPTHRWRAIGHLAEAESELMREHLDIAISIREHRLAYISDDQYFIPIDDLIRRMTEREEVPSEAL